jgi:Winged helix-turn helix
MEEAAELRALARVERDPRQRVRLLAIANVRDGLPVDEAARATGMGRATLYRWLARERAGGPAALKDRPRAGRRRKLDAAQRAEVRTWILAGPDVERDGVVAWRGGGADRAGDGRAALQGQAGALQRLPAAGRVAPLGAGATAAPPRRRRPGGAGRLSANFPARVGEVGASLPPGTPVEVWFGDEMRVGQKGTLTRVWAARPAPARPPRARTATSRSTCSAPCARRATWGAR